ncbi:SDR family oxidoreductase [Methylovorus sp. MP688]|uniref:SDR family oxidoreductase n=1 Tax=Methylovorus sp. (strain MP688) TaxID=887061 RepID=UPI0001EC44C1|nr:SDR family oxidoreductase [Methylovorus sp. MP688]ADQ83750.1 NmrA family protein [Methylovorus sp. MP688]
MIVITGASGQLGRLVIEALLSSVPANQIIAAVRSPAKVADLAARGVVVRQADYTHPATLDAAFDGATQILLISSSEIGQRLPQHQNVIAAAKRANVSLLAYTSLLHADTTPLPIATEHKATEEALRNSGLPYVILRNGWYTENYAASIQPALQHGVLLGSAGDGKIASASRSDYAAAAAAVLRTPNQAGKVYELAGDTAYTLAEFAAELSRVAGKTVTYQNLPEAAYKQALLDAGLPDFLAVLLAESDTGASQGALFDDSHQLSQLIGRPTTPLATAIAAAL